MLLRLKGEGNRQSGSVTLVNPAQIAWFEAVWNNSQFAIEPGMKVKIKFISGIEHTTSLDEQRAHQFFNALNIADWEVEDAEVQEPAAPKGAS